MNLVFSSIMLKKSTSNWSENKQKKKREIEMNNEKNKYKLTDR